MASVALLHNPGAGDEEHEKKDLIAMIEKAGHECRYSSTKSDGWKKFDDTVDFLVVAGGDGTIKKITKELLRRSVLEKTYPIALLPLGTANNIAKSVGIAKNPGLTLTNWQEHNCKKFDVGKINNVEKASFFLESFGYGLFPYLMQKMEDVSKSETDTPEKNLQAALKLLYELTQTYKPTQCKLTLDGKDYSGKFLLVEVMNIKSIGPNLLLSPDADPGDGVFEVVTIHETEREKFAAYIAAKIEGKEEPIAFTTVIAKDIKMSWQGKHSHADDKVLKIPEGEEVVIEMKKGLLNFIVE